MTKAELEEYLADGLSLDQIGKLVGRNPSTISYHLKKHGLKPVNQGKHANKGRIEEGVTRSFAEAQQEARKCVLLCSNCHAEVEAGMTEVPMVSRLRLVS
jgi:IS30 family transposase